MTPGHRVARVQAKDKRVARKRYPWAQTIVRVGSTLVCYESPEDAGEEHGEESLIFSRQRKKSVDSNAVVLRF